MIRINLEGSEFKLRNLWSEITLGELEQIHSLLKGNSFISNWKRIINLLSSWPESEMAKWNTKDFVKLTDLILPLDDIKLQNGIQTLSIGERRFIYEPNKMTARVGRDIQKAYFNEDHFSLIMSTVFKEIGNSNSDWETIKERASCLKEATADNFISILWMLNAQVVMNLNKKIQREVKTSS